MTTDTMYYEHANGRWEGWAYSDGQRIPLVTVACKGDAIAYASRKGYRFVEVAS